mmetsp:Transcript_66677/g.148816  ORF Transcript_66677/g.148816 Transcript_66677/m.148816 type:complete len:286 (-) Transcript_66677:376-1233(-)
MMLVRDPTVAELLALMRSPDEAERDDALSSLAGIIGTAFGDDGAEIGCMMRSNGGPAILTWLLADPNPEVQQLSLMILGNLCSDSVDRESGKTKAALLSCGGARAILSVVHTEDEQVLVFACGALQNLCYERAWAELVVKHSVHRRLEALLAHSEPMVVRYAAGALKNITDALQMAGLSEEALAAVQERSQQKRREDFSRNRASSVIASALRAIPETKRQQREAQGILQRQRRDTLHQIGSESPALSRPASASSTSSRSSYCSAKSSLTASTAASAALNSTNSRQ